MVANFLKMLVRVARRQASYSLINIAGFSLGIGTALIIALYVSMQLSYESFNANADRIVRVTEKIRPTGVGQPSASIPIPVGPQLKEDFSHLVENSARVFRFESPSMLSHENFKFNERKVIFADNCVFPVFSFELISGNQERVLTEPNQIVLSKSLALKYFGTTDAIGKTLRYDDKLDLKVTGIMSDARTNSHFQPTALISFHTLTSLLTERQITSWFWNPAYTYLMLHDSEQATNELQSGIDGFMKKYFNETKYKNKYLELQPLKSIHLTSSFDNELEPVGSWMYVRIIMVIGAFVLVLAVINFINLSTARALNRAREVGVRKVLGSARSQIVLQFLLESCSLTLLATSVGAALALAVIPFVNDYLGISISVTSEQFWIFYLLLPFAVCVGLLSGIYPSLYLSSFQPVKVLKGKLWSGTERNSLRQSLVVVQFVVTITLIVSSIVVWRQFNFMQTRDVGFRKENVLMIPVQRSALGKIDNFQILKTRLELEDGIVNVTAAEDIVGKGHNSGSYMPEGLTDPVLYPRLFVREDFNVVFDLKILAGKAFETPYQSPPNVRELMINESLVKSLGWGSPDEAIGKKMGEFTIDGNLVEQRVTGVFRDFNFVSLHKAVGPLILEAPPTDDVVNLFMIKYIAVRIDAAKQQEILPVIEQYWNALADGKIFEYSFLEDQLESVYSQENTLSRMNTIFSALAIIVSCLGLIGLASYVLEQRQKEVSIRKVLGSSVTSIALMLGSYFVRIIIIASVISVPVAYFTLDAWLSNFAYRIEMSAMYFVFAIIITFVVALLVTGRQTLKTALIQPVKMLRSE